MADQRRDLGRALVAEIRKVGRQVKPAIGRHQVLDAVEVAAEGEVVDALLAAAALPVQIDGNEPRAFGRADGKMADRAGISLQGEVLLDLADSGGNIFAAARAAPEPRRARRCRAPR